MHDDEGDGPNLRRWYLIIGAAPAFGYVWLAITYPWIWAGVTAVLVVLGAGWFTARIVLRLENRLAVWGLTPVFGLAWLLLFWLVFYVQSLLQ